MSEFDDLREWSDVQEKDVLVLNTTMTCPLSCDFCCYGCNPKRKEKMPLAEALRLIDQVAELDCFSSIGFTGGEPLYYLDEFLKMTDRAALHAIPYTVATSGFWGADSAQAKITAAHLKATGLRRLNISCDPSHAEFVTPEAVSTAAKLVAATGIPVYIVGTFTNPEDTLKNFVPDLTEVNNVHLVDKIVAKVGRATKWDVNYGAAATDKVKTCYRRVYHDLVVFWDGKTYPCCSTFNRATPGLVVGNAFEEGLSAIRTRVEASLLFRVIKREGFPELYKIIKRLDPELFARMPKFDEYPGACSACNAIFKKDDIAQRVYKVFDLYRTQEILKSMDKVDQILGKENAAAFFENMLVECS
ncbi:radical SAM/SPASM domain-containing protein [Sphingorhabdus sp. Alg239-R122]|uniref:radical SAM/SPASM domain-containing protein n=1 Tax=Sphingorhabdus sp. Alg239-R122 TaxID=2305989 RepID=UPI0013D97440|nr:radical SAM/SPASM domain-containing protein [Sphingorhabdus sp. Alg239-R122]